MHFVKAGGHLCCTGLAASAQSTAQQHNHYSSLYHMHIWGRLRKQNKMQWLESLIVFSQSLHHGEQNTLVANDSGLKTLYSVFAKHSG